MDTSRILCVPDLHLPYCHIDSIDFLSKIQRTLQPTLIIIGGDELDLHAMSFHDNDPDLDSAGKELRKAIEYLSSVKALFPSAQILESNHGSLLYRKAKHHGIPRHMLKSYNEVLEVDDKWKWNNSLIVKLPNGNKCKFVHQASANVLAASQASGMSLVQFHYHSQLEIRYWDSDHGVHFGATCGSLVDDTSLAMAYNKLDLKRPQIGCMYIENSIPTIIPMMRDQNNRWVGTR